MNTLNTILIVLTTLAALVFFHLMVNTTDINQSITYCAAGLLNWVSAWGLLIQLQLSEK